MTAMEVIKVIAETYIDARFTFAVCLPSMNKKELGANTLPVSALLEHHSKERRINFRGYEIVHGDIIPEIKEGETLDISSKIAITQDTDLLHEGFHIPLIDFDCPKTALDTVKFFLNLIGQKEGAILDSGRSFHYYGLWLLEESEWFNFIGDCLLSNLVDHRYFGHQLKDHEGFLRITACPLRPKIPEVVAIL